MELVGKGTYFGHQRHVVGSRRKVELPKEADTHDKEEPVAGGAGAEQIFVVPPLRKGVSTSWNTDRTEV